MTMSPEKLSAEKMSPEQWARLKELFRVAFEYDPTRRAAYLDEACADDTTLRAEIESLLASHDHAENFIESPAFADTVKAITDAPAEQIAGRHVGSYQLIREIGRGGMGTVYLAQRADEEYEKLVAIKVVRRGMDTEDILRRFRNERQILASLDHPNIARLLDGGTTEDGLPYLVMEYVEGTRVTDYCDEHRLTTNERLKLFRAICAAVQHAHQNLVVHRDLKPSNILITPEGTPKLLDFGIAKVLDAGPSALAASHTLTELRVFTPDYASPEQVRGENLTTSSDVYSLGVVLYELLTGHRPYRSVTAPPHDLARVICEQEPTKPSQAISDYGSRIADSTRLSSDPPSAIRNPQSLRGDLDNIILMALRKEPARRYASVGQFSEDIRRHLDALPVVARKDTYAYRTTKFVRRNRLGVAAAGVVLLSLLGGFVATAWQARAARAQARAAREEKARAESVSTFLAGMLKYSNPLINVPGKQGGATTMQDVLDEAAKRLDGDEFSQQPEVRAELEKIIADSYFGQGRQDLHAQHLKEFVRLQKSLNRENDPQTIVATAVWAHLLFADQNLTESEKAFREVLPRMRAGHEKGNIPAQDLTNALNTFGYLRRTQGDSHEAEAAFREVLAIGPEIPRDERLLTTGLTRSTLASTLADQGRFDEALETSREAVAEYRQTGRTDMADFGFVLTVYGGFLTDRGDFAEADESLIEAETILRRRQSPTSLWLGDNLRNQAVSFYHQGKYAESQSKVTEAEKIYLKSFGTSYDHYPTVLIARGLILDKTGKSPEGEKILREALRLRVASLPTEHFWVAVAKGALGECLTTQKRFAEAEPLLDESYAALDARLGRRDPRTVEALRRLASLYGAWGKPAQSAQYRALLAVR
jgi:serine/threonine-protein kinase